MNLPGKRWVRHWFWILAFKYPRFRVALTRLFVPSRNIDIQLFGAHLHINTRDEIGLWRAAKMADDNVIFRDEVASLLNLALLLQPGDTFVDVGANVGLYTSVLSRFPNVFPKTKFIAIEPNPETAARLRKSVEHTTVLEMGISDRAAELPFSPGVTSGVFKVVNADAAANAMNIRCERLDSLPLNGSDLVVKIDVEEHEWSVLQGAATLFQNKRIQVIYLDGYSDVRIPGFLRERGFTLFDGRTLTRCGAEAPRSLLGVHETRLSTANGN
ncbi:MAG TPA: FkbM family methyltransferase [Chthoniobacterales bacterium]|jgi:FkbM family methyltransferase